MNPEHFDKLKAGVQAFNEWRRANSEQDEDDQIDLSGANLSGAVLDHVNLDQADLSHANLSGAKMDSGNLCGANLSGANLSQAKIIYSSLLGTNLSGANLSGASLESSMLDRANLSGANVSGAILDGLRGANVNLNGVDLKAAKSVHFAELTRASTTRIGGEMEGVTKGKGPYACTLTGTLTIDDRDFPARMEVAFDYTDGKYRGTFQLFDETDAKSTLQGVFLQEDEACYLHFDSTSDTGRFTGCVNGRMMTQGRLNEKCIIAFE